MDFEKILIIAFILIVIFNFIKESIDEKEKKRKEIEFNDNHARLGIIRKKEIEKPAPDHIRKSLSEFEDSYRRGEVNFGSMNDFSPLAAFGYRVGKTNGVSENIRRQIVHFTWHAEIPSFIPKEYANSWCRPGTYGRYNKILSHITMLARQRKHRKGYELAVEEWESDAEWFRKESVNLAIQYKQYGFEK